MSFDKHTVAGYTFSMGKRRHVKTVADTIRSEIKASGLTLYRIGKDADVDVAVLWRFMQDERTITLRTADRVCRALGLRLTKGR